MLVEGQVGAGDGDRWLESGRDLIFDDIRWGFCHLMMDFDGFGFCKTFGPTR